MQARRVGGQRRNSFQGCPAARRGSEQPRWLAREGASHQRGHVGTPHIEAICWHRQLCSYFMRLLYRLERPSLGRIYRVGAEAPYQRPGARVAPAVVLGASGPGVDDGVAAGSGHELPALGGGAVGGAQGDVQARHRQGEPAGGGGEESRGLVLGEAQDGLGLGHEHSEAVTATPEDGSMVLTIL